MAKKDESFEKVERCVACKGRLSNSLFPICNSPICYMRTVSLFESQPHKRESHRAKGKKGGTTEEAGVIEDKAEEE